MPARRCARCPTPRCCRWRRSRRGWRSRPPRAPPARSAAHEPRGPRRASSWWTTGRRTWWRWRPSWSRSAIRLVRATRARRRCGRCCARLRRDPARRADAGDERLRDGAAHQVAGALAHTPIIFLTAISKDEEYVFEGYSVGAVDYMFKPFNPDVLRSKVAVFVDLYLKTSSSGSRSELLRQSERRELELRHRARCRSRRRARRDRRARHGRDHHVRRRSPDHPLQRGRGADLRLARARARAGEWTSS
jgi:CheY-like chemotaxis protein